MHFTKKNAKNFAASAAAARARNKSAQQELDNQQAAAQGSASCSRRSATSRSYVGGLEAAQRLTV